MGTQDRFQVKRMFGWFVVTDCVECKRSDLMSEPNAIKLAERLNAKADRGETITLDGWL